MQVSEIQLKIIATGPVPAFLVLYFIVPKTASTTILSGIVTATGFVVCFIGMSMRQREAKEPEDLLAMPPEKS